MQAARASKDDFGAQCRPRELQKMVLEQNADCESFKRYPSSEEEEKVVSFFSKGLEKHPLLQERARVRFL